MSPSSPSRSVSPWFGRRFESSYPVELFPNLRSRLLGTPARLEEALRTCTPALRVAAPPGRWSAQETGGHLLDLEPLWLARVEDYVSGNPELTVADLQNRKTKEADHNAQPLERLLRDFRAARSRLLARVDQLEIALFSTSLPHPRLRTPMRLVDHLFFVAEHDDHHLAQIHELCVPLEPSA